MKKIGRWKEMERMDKEGEWGEDRVGGGRNAGEKTREQRENERVGRK